MMYIVKTTEDGQTYEYEYGCIEHAREHMKIEKSPYKLYEYENGTEREITDTTTEESKEGNTMTREEAINAIIEYFNENEDTFNACIEELDSYNGYLGDDRYYSMDELSELYHDEDPIELLNRAYFGYDAETWHTDAHGEKEYGPFNPNRDYFTFNGYGNFVSADYKDYSDKIDEYAVEQMADNRQWIDEIDNDEELSKLFDILEDDEEEEEE